MKHLIAAFSAMLICVVLPAHAENTRSSHPNAIERKAPSPVLDAATAEPVTIPEKLIDNLQKDFKLTKDQAAGIAGNLAHESGNFRILKEINGGCYGYSQWCGPRKTQFRNHADQVGGQDSFDANYGYLAHELRNYYEPMMRRIRSTNSVEQVARIFMKQFLRPRASTANLPRRVRFSKLYLANRYDGAGCYSHPRLEGASRPAPCPGDRL